MSFLSAVSDMARNPHPGPRSSWWLRMPVAMLCALAGIGSAHALQWRPLDSTLTPAQAAATQSLLDDAAARLPAAWASALDRPITVEWHDLPPQVHGRALRDRILLDRTLLDRWMQRAPGAGLDDAHARAPLAAVIHELAHFYDRTPQGRLSRDPRLLDLAGWQVSPLRLGRRRSRNAFSDRSPDPYELTSPAEFVAVNLEHFLLDPHYACRRPALHRHFASHLRLSPPRAECAPGQVFLQVDRDAPPLLQLDPERIYEIDYLLAEPDDRVMSRWGHGMLRLVVCAPHRPPGPDCRLDLAHHRVLSFRAFVDDVQISNWRGLTGSYPSRLFVLPLAQVIDEYTKVELRGLRSVPLRLQRAEIATLLERAAKLHWSYDGRYYFLSNNCAVETFKLLHDGVPRLAGERLASLTPTGLMRRLERAGIARTDVLADDAEARRLGYFFEPASAHFQTMFDVARAGLGLPQMRVEDWLVLPPRTRAPWLDRADLRTAAALLLLEHAALRRDEQLARDELKRRFLGRGRANLSDEPGALDAARELLQLQSLLTRPAALLPGAGYGLPQLDEREALTLEAERHAARWRERDTRLHDDARRWLTPQRRASLGGIEANIGRLSERLSRLHRQQGGLELRPSADGSPPAIER
jgi:hypothetical protein